MKIVKIGTWDKGGSPIGWHFDLKDADPGTLACTDKTKIPYCLGLARPSDPFCPVTINGVEVSEWTSQRRIAMS